ncbi:hypothetical protein HH310_12655 [Actinoplanes sp. TBRC 11911]|uniref:hypothetical protein n=1 Tax=Actinoplanes sp. TBRC 11911 TaxID=2729386 RepID=UPI00145F1F49|nr:hypothetical protein [Actinoplanes sp. TBRC 11911]NMO52044.1 hypothetical protein [Actinoplanes sp. TBRC 11911]
MSTQPPRPGDLVPIKWPDGLHDFVIEYIGEPTGYGAAQPGWTWLRGVVVEPEGQHRNARSFYVQLVDGEYQMRAGHLPARL